MTSWSHLCQHPVQWKSSKIVLFKPCPSEVETSPGTFHHLSRSLLWCYIILMAKKMIFEFTFFQPVSVTFCLSTVLQKESGPHHLYIFPIRYLYKASLSPSFLQPEQAMLSASTCTSSAPTPATFKVLWWVALMCQYLSCTAEAKTRCDQMTFFMYEYHSYL